MSEQPDGKPHMFAKRVEVDGVAWVASSVDEQDGEVMEYVPEADGPNCDTDYVFRAGFHWYGWPNIGEHDTAEEAMRAQR